MKFKQPFLKSGLLATFMATVSACTVEPDYGEPPDLTRFFDTPTGECVPYTESASFRSRDTTIVVDPLTDWISVIESAPAGTEILFEDGEYEMGRFGVSVSTGLTIRSVSGDRDRVQIRGNGYDETLHGFMILGDDITMADLSIADIRNHAIAVSPESGALSGVQLYNLDIRDIGTQHIKVNPGGNRDGLIACSNIGYSIGGAVGDYNGAIDLHGSIDWVIRDNTIYNITGDGSGCNIDQECGQFISSPAIYAWNGAEGTKVIGNTIVDSFRNISLGMGSNHYGGLILHNEIIQSTSGDAGIELFGARDVVVEFNIVKLSGRYPGSIEFRGSNNLTITNNWLSSRPWNRGGNANVELSGNAFRVPECPICAIVSDAAKQTF